MTVRQRKLLLVAAISAMAVIAASAAFDIAVAAALNHSIGRLTGTRAEVDRVHLDLWGGVTCPCTI